VNRWTPVAGGMMLNFALGSLFAWSVFVLPLEHEFGWTRAQTSWVFTFAMMSTTVCLVLGGILQDRRGPRVGAAIGALAIGTAYLLASRTQSLLYLYVTFGIIGGIANGIGYAATVPVASKWFPDRRGLAVGLIVAAYGGGSAIIAPAAAALVEVLGWRTTFRVLGMTFFAMAAVGAALLRNPPATLNSFTPVGDMASAPEAPRAISLYQMLGTRTFWSLWIGYWLGTTAGMMTISQLVPFARSAGLSAAAATFAITVGACGNIGGRIFSGWLSDALGRLRTLRVMIVISAFAMPSLFWWRDQPVVFYLLVAVVYWCYGTQLSVFGSTAADFFGTRNLGRNYGALLTAVGLAGTLGPILGAQTFDRVGHYGYAFFAAGGLAVVALAALAFARPPVIRTEMTRA
jgi:OFA family oxalate/formate antiporter-like MFS transporter